MAYKIIELNEFMPVTVTYHCLKYNMHSFPVTRFRGHFILDISVHGHLNLTKCVQGKHFPQKKTYKK